MVMRQQRKKEQKIFVPPIIIIIIKWPEMLASEMHFFQEWNYSQNITEHIYQTLSNTIFRVHLIMTHHCTWTSRLILAAFINARNQCKWDCMLMNCPAANWCRVLMNLNLCLPTSPITGIAPLVCKCSFCANDGTRESIGTTRTESGAVTFNKQTSN